MKHTTYIIAAFIVLIAVLASCGTRRVSEDEEPTQVYVDLGSVLSDQDGNVDMLTEDGDTVAIRGVTEEEVRKEREDFLNSHDLL